MGMPPSSSERSRSNGRLDVAEPARAAAQWLRVFDGALEASVCRKLIAGAADERWLTTTAEIPRAANGPHVPQRVGEPDRPCRLVDGDQCPAFALIDDPVFALRLFYRLAQDMPERLGLAELAGLKPLFRLVRLNTGEATRAHRDAVREAADGLRSALSLVVFLNDDLTGGTLTFPEIGRTIEPRRGRAVVFSQQLLHQDTEVTQGSRYALESEVFYSERWRAYTR